ncbi:hypothetical protein NO2_0418 [Candidatus Termititenax persephonae]|uniref:Uncharacterized protein n=1 Tax=Candidatus Termititenax persephonae TaxID=2218525 RepID=A0A388TFF4_9BACT|nr:hypothetical protein NO2_0418 [Candidatus Termititenax persephonae]
MDISDIINYIVTIVGLGASFVSIGVSYGSLKNKVEQHAEDIKNHRENIGKLFDAQRDVSTLTAKLEGRLEVIETTLNRIAEKIERVLER